MFEFLVMPFGLTNAPVSFQSLINAVSSNYLRNLSLLFIDDIVITVKIYKIELLILIASLSRDSTSILPKNRNVLLSRNMLVIWHMIKWGKGIS